MASPLVTAARWIERHFEEAIACACLALVAVCVMLQVVLRYGFHTALTWTEELAGFAMAWAVYMGAALGVRERFHIRILIGVVSLPRPIGLPVMLSADLCWLGFNLFMLWHGFAYLQVLWTFPAYSPALGINQVWPQSIIVVGYLLMTVRLLQLYAGWLGAGARGLPGLPKEFQNAANGDGLPP